MTRRPSHHRTPRAAWLALLIAAAGAASACSDASDPTTGTHIGNPGELEFRVSSALTAADGEVRSRDASGTDFTFTEILIHVRDVELDLPAGVTCADVEGELQGARCDRDSLKVVLDGPFVLDLLNRTSTPALDARLPALSWRRIDFRLDDAEGATGDPLLDAHSFAARGDFERDGQMVALEVQLRFNEDARVESPGGVQLADGDRLIVDFDAGAWLTGLSIGGCLDRGDLSLDGDRLRIDDDSDCDDLEKTLKDNIKNSTSLLSDD